jgi:DNA-binding CsgD family transcriptional regulator
MLKTDDYRRLMAIIEDAERATSLSAFRRATLDAMDGHLGYPRTAFLTGTTDEPKIDGVVHGIPQRRLDAYLTRLSQHGLVHAAVSRPELDRTQPIALEDIHGALDDSDRAGFDEFLASQQITGLLGVWLDTGGPTQGLLMLLTDAKPFGTVDHERLQSLAPHLGNLLRHHLPRHVKVAAAPLLTPREAETVDLVAAGYSNRTIARRLNVTESTVKKHVSAALNKLSVSSRTQLTLAWLGGETSPRVRSRRLAA